MNRATIVILVFLWGMLMGWLSLVAGCHTVGGIGKDLQDWSSPYTQRD